MDPIADLLKSPWQLQLSLGSGYAAYLVSYVGIRAHHKTIDTAFSSLVFGLVATGIFSVSAVKVGPIPSSALAFFSACAVAVFWRKFGRIWLAWVIRREDLSWSNDDPTALATLLDDTHNNMSQIAVLTKDGDWLRCDNTDSFASSPFGPCKIGPNGDVAMYLTHSKSKGEDAKELGSTKDLEFGDRMTYIPSESIQRINFRFKPKPNHRSKAAALWREVVNFPKRSGSPHQIG